MLITLSNKFFKVEQDGEDIVIPVNYLNSEGRTILPSHPELEPQYLQQYRGSKVAVARLFIMTADGEKLAEVRLSTVLRVVDRGYLYVGCQIRSCRPNFS